MSIDTSTTSMESVIRKLSQQIRQHEIRLDILKHDADVWFVLEKDEISAITSIIEQKIEHLKSSVNELKEDVSEVKTQKIKFPRLDLFA
jgi:hypothetical protein